MVKKKRALRVLLGVGSPLTSGEGDWGVMKRRRVRGGGEREEKRETERGDIEEIDKGNIYIYIYIYTDREREPGRWRRRQADRVR